MKIADIEQFDIGNGPGIRVTVWISGCTRHCDGCFNKEAQDFEYGTAYNRQTILDMVADPRVSGLTLLGGDPLCQTAHDILELCWLAQAVKDMGKTVWMWTGECIDSDLFDIPRDIDMLARQTLIEKCDVVVDGPYVKDKSGYFVWRGSSNQRVIDIQNSLSAQYIVQLKVD